MWLCFSFLKFSFNVELHTFIFHAILMLITGPFSESASA